MAARSMERARASRKRASPASGCRRREHQGDQVHGGGRPDHPAVAEARRRSVGPTSTTSALPSSRSANWSRGAAAELDIDRIQERTAAPIIVVGGERGAAARFECRRAERAGAHQAAFGALREYQAVVRKIEQQIGQGIGWRASSRRRLLRQGPRPAEPLAGKPHRRRPSAESHPGT